jgi:hypothetical protein
MDQLAVTFLVLWLVSLVAVGAGVIGFLLWFYDPGVIAWGSVWYDLRAARAVLRITRTGQATLEAMLAAATRFGR